MPHIIVKLWPGKSEAQKAQLADAIVQNAKEILSCGEESLSVAFEEIPADEWKEKVYDPEIVHAKGKLYKKPGYTM